MYKEGIAATVIFLAAYVLIAVMVIWSIPLAFGTAIEQQNPTWQEQLRDRAAEWNVMTAINQTLDRADNFTYSKGDYCSADEWGHVEYCVVGKGIQCSEPLEQMICQEHNRRLEKLGQ